MSTADMKCGLLLVDDDPCITAPMAERMAIRGFRVVVAGSGAEALGLLEKNSDMDVVVLDIRMPGMDGIETLHEIKKNYPLLGVIILTGHASVRTSVEAIKSGALEYLEKPYDIEQLVAILTAALARKREFEERIYDARIKPYCSDRERQGAISELLEEAAGRHAPGDGSGKV